MAKLIRPQAVDQFCKILRVPESAVSETVLDAVRNLDERRELEPGIQEILFDPNQTPHGPTEIADIITSRVILQGEKINAAFILKGKSFKKVRSTDIAHQILKVTQLQDLGLMVLCAVGDIQDDAHRDFVTGALNAGVDYLILDRLDTARLLLAYEKICPDDGTPFDEEGQCEHGHALDDGIALEIRIRDDHSYEVLRLRDISHAGAKRYAAVVLIDPHYEREVIRRIVTQVTEELKTSRYHRNEMVDQRWKGTEAHVVWLYIAGSIDDVRNTNWLARTEWIDPQLDEQWRPMELDGDELIEGISLKWNPMYEDMREFHSSHTASKGDALSVLEPLIHRAIELGRQAEHLIEDFEAGKVTIAQLDAEFTERVAEVQQVYKESGDLPFPPVDLEDYDQVCQSLFADVDNIYLGFTKLGREKWSTVEARVELAKTHLGSFREDLERWKFEQEKIH